MAKIENLRRQRDESDSEVDYGIIPQKNKLLNSQNKKRKLGWATTKLMHSQSLQLKKTEQKWPNYWPTK